MASSFRATAVNYNPSWRDPGPVPNVPIGNQNPIGVSLYNRRTPASGNSSTDPTLIREPPRAIISPARPAPRGGSRRNRKSRRNHKKQSRKSRR